MRDRVTDTKNHTLPLRLIPKRSWLYSPWRFCLLSMAFGLFFIALSIVDVVNVFGIGVSLAALGILVLAHLILSLRKRRSFWRIQIDELGVTANAFPDEKFCRWSDVSRFEVILKMVKGGGQPRYENFVVALPSTGRFSSEQEWEERSVLCFEAFGSGIAHQAAEQLASWLNELRTLAVDGKLKNGSDLTVPAIFRAISIKGNETG